MLIHHFLENSAERFPDKIAVKQAAGKATYKQINARADALAACLRDQGVTRGDRIALLLENSIDYIIAYYGVLKAGAVASPLNPALKPDGLQYLLDDLEPAGVITSFKSERLLKAVRLDTGALKLVVIRAPKQKWAGPAWPVLDFDACSAAGPAAPIQAAGPACDLSSIIYTSGSTGKPKGVMLSHRNVVSNTAAIYRYLSISATDIQMVVLPFFYVMGKSLLNTHVAAGATVILNNRFIYPADVVHQMIEEKVTAFSGVPSTYAYLLNRSPLAGCKDRLGELRYCSQAGGHMAASLKRSLRRILPQHTRLFIMYGATEASARLTYLDPAHLDAKIGSIGKPIPEVTVRILDERGRDVPDGGEGELVAAGPNIMLGYWKDERETRRVLDSRGYHTGDIGYRDKDGFLYVLGRRDGLLKSGGHRINPVEIEDFLMATDLIIESAVVGIPDDLLGSKLVALVVPRQEEVAADDLMKRCADGLPKHKWPAAIVITRALPKNASGKIDRQKCIATVSRR